MTAKKTATKRRGSSTRKAAAKRPRATKKAAGANGRDLNFETKLWQAADALRGRMDPSEYKHVVLGLVFLKYISDAFEARRAELEAEAESGADPEDPDEYRAAGVFWVPAEARWEKLKAAARQPTIGQLIDDAMAAIERDNPSLKGALQKDYARPTLDKVRLGQTVDLVSDIGLGDAENRAKDTLGRVYEYFLARFASAEGRGGGEFYTPGSIVRLLVEMIEPFKGRVYDPCCGSGGMFVQSEAFLEAHGGRRRDLSVYGQEANATTWRLARMNLAIRGIEAKIHYGDTFTSDGFPDLKANYVLANPPFNVSDWNGHLLREDKRWKHGVPPEGNANFAWLQHILHHLAPGGVAGVVLANGSMSSMQSGEGEIRKHMVEADVVDCMVSLPGNLFYTTPIPACLWFLARDRAAGRPRERRREVLFIDARQMGHMVDRTQRQLSADDIARIAETYHAWRGGAGVAPYQDVSGFCKSASVEEIAERGYALNPGRYVGSEAQSETDEPFDDQMRRLASLLSDLRSESTELDEAIATTFEQLGYAQ